jgi:DNA-binding CsgD family transcriptional regulator
MSENTSAPEPVEPDESDASPHAEAYLSEQDIRAIVRLLGEVAAIRTGHIDQKRYLLNGILRIVEGDVWVWTQGFSGSLDRPPAAIQLLDEGWRDDAQRTWFYRAISEEKHVHPGQTRMAAILGDKPEHHTALKQQLVTHEEFVTSENYQQFYQHCGLSACIISYYPVSSVGHFSGIGVHRVAGKPDFTERDRRIVHLIASEIDWLHRAGVPESPAPSAVPLTQRQRQVLFFLLAGDSVKQVATKLELSTHTINDYVKVIHKHYNVGSRGELLAKFLGTGTHQKKP